MNPKFLVIGMAAVVIIAYFYLDTTGTIFGKAVEEFGPVDWDKVKTRDIVKNSIPVSLLEENGACKVKAETFNLIISHQYFVKSQELAKELQYDEELKTIVVSCDKLKGDPSRLNVWYVIPEAENYPTKYEYFITEWEETPNQN